MAQRSQRVLVTREWHGAGSTQSRLGSAREHPQARGHSHTDAHGRRRSHCIGDAVAALPLAATAAARSRLAAVGCTNHRRTPETPCVSAPARFAACPARAEYARHECTREPYLGSYCACWCTAACWWCCCWCCCCICCCTICCCCHIICHHREASRQSRLDEAHTPPDRRLRRLPERGRAPGRL